MRLLLMSDTHMPARARRLPGVLLSALDDVDAVVHAGDWTTPDLLDQLIARTPQVVGVFGNNDGPDLRDRLPEIARVTLRGLRLAVVHETGARAGREARCAARYPDTDVLVFGHSHIPWDTTASTGLRLLNPGSPTDRRRQPFGSFMTARIGDGALLDVVLHRVVPDR